MFNYSSYGTWLLRLNTSLLRYGLFSDYFEQSCYNYYFILIFLKTLSYGNVVYAALCHLLSAFKLHLLLIKFCFCTVR